MIRHDVDDMIRFLNSLLTIDAAWVSEMMRLRPPCNAELARHPSVQVIAGPFEARTLKVPPGEWRAGLIGLLNGYFGTIDSGPKRGWGPITAHIDDDGKVTRFYRTEENGQP